MNKYDDKDVDWSVFDQFSEMTCYCNCGPFPGFTYRSHTKLVTTAEKKFLHVSRNPCPNCGSNCNLRGSSSDPEQVVVSR